MSQKPRTGAPAQATSVPKAAPKDVVMLAAPTKALPVIRMEPVVAAEPVVKAESVAKVEPVEVTPTVTTEPEVMAEPIIEEVSVAKAEPVAMLEPETTFSPPVSVNETIATTSDLAAASVEGVTETMTATADTVAAVTEEAVETASSVKPTKSTITQGMKTMMKSTEEFVAFGQANLEAFMKSGQIWSAGVQELTKQFATSAKASFEESVSTFKAMSTVKSVKEAMELQSTFAKAALEKAMAESNKLTDASIKLTEQTLAPITARVTVAVETFGKTA
jgi:phasin family protein